MAELGVAPPASLAAVTMGEGDTPLATLRLSGREVLAKLECESPTRSFKDRGAAYLIAAALDLGATRVVADSSGNAGVSIAAYASKAGLPCEVFVAATTPRDKIEHIDAPVHLVDGTREDVAAAAVAHVEASGAFYASHVWNPWFFEGTKHYVNELIVQLGGHLPAALLLPVGNGTLVLGAWRAMQERAVMTPIVAVQAELCAPIAAAFARGDEAAAHVVNRGTVAAGVAIAAPVRGAEILAAIRNTAGSVVTVTDAEIMAAASELAGQGYDVEPTAAVPAAALPQLGPARAGWADVVVPVAAAGTGGR